MPARSGTSSSSMNTATSFSSSWLDGSPSRKSPARSALRSSRGSLHLDPYDSPSRKVQIEFLLMLEQSDRDFNERLAQADAERARIHKEELAKAASEHERVQRGAQLEIERIILEEERERFEREEAQRCEVVRQKEEKTRRELAVKQKRLEALQKEERALEEVAKQDRKIQELEEKLKTQKEREAAKQKKAQEEAERNAKEAAAAKQQATVQHPPQRQAPQPATASLASASKQTPPAVPSAAAPGVEELHSKYLELHKRMKEFRIQFYNTHKQKGAPLKATVGDMRRAIRTRIGQITVERKDSVAAIGKLREEAFNLALTTPGPTIDIRPFIISHQVPNMASDAEAQYPALLLYAWICFEKTVIQQFEKEAASEDGRIIQEIGLIAASLFADQRYTFKGIPMIDILLAKLHRKCPVLFGVRGNMNNKEGQVRLGWRDGDGLNSYNQRMIGMGCGYAALSLRQFSGKIPAIPMSEYWRAIARIANTPTDALWDGHFALLKGLVRDYYRKFLSFYGMPAQAALRRATIDLATRAPQRCAPAAGTVKVLTDNWKAAGLNLE